jgi:upstream activation factor subunit UAF30
MAKSTTKTAEKAAPKAADKAAEKPAAAAKGKKVAAPKGEGAKPNALQQPLKPSPELAAVVGDAALPRGEVVSKVWEYIKKHELQNPENKREILADDKLEKVFGTKKVTMFEMNKHFSAHLK